MWPCQVLFPAKQASPISPVVSRRYRVDREETDDRLFLSDLGFPRCREEHPDEGVQKPLIGSGTPKEAAARAVAWLFFAHTDQAALIILVAPSGDDLVVLMIGVPANDPG